jgi:hypothetical protein
MKIRIFICTVLLFGLAISGLGQKKETQRMSEARLWRFRADNITNTLLKEAVRLDELDRAFLYAKLGDLWWKFDQNQSDAWFIKSVDAIDFYSDEDIKNNLENYYKKTSQVLKLISNRNNKQTNRLIKIIAEVSEISDKAKNTNADTLIDFALLIVKDNPKKAIELGNLAFKIGMPENLYKLYWELRKSSPTDADNFITGIIINSANKVNAQLISNLKTAVFPETIFQNISAKFYSSDPIKLKTLNLMSEYILQQQGKLSSKLITNCSIESGVVASLKNQINLFLPQKAPLIEQAINVCVANQSKEAQDLQNSGIGSSSNGKVTIESLLNLADEAKNDLNIRSYYLFRAAYLANEQKKYKIATEILSGMSKAEIETDQDDWADLSVEVAAGLAYQLFQEQDLSGSIRVLDAIPTDYKAVAKILFVSQFKASDLTAREFCIERLREAEKDFQKSEKPFAQKAGYWMKVVRIFSSYKMYNEASESFKEIVKAFNKSDYVTESDGDGLSYIFSNEFFESQESSILDAVSNLSNPKNRIGYYLGFLKISLNEVEELSKKLPKTTTETVKKAI